MLKGLIVRWTDKNPLDDTSEVIPGKITHRNPMRMFYADQIFLKSKSIITSERAFMWLVTMSVVFKYPNGVNEQVDREIKAFCMLDDIDDICDEEIRDAMRHGDMNCYVHTEFTIECLGSNDLLLQVAS